MIAILLCHTCYGVRLVKIRTKSETLLDQNRFEIMSEMFYQSLMHYHWFCYKLLFLDGKLVFYKSIILLVLICLDFLSLLIQWNNLLFILGPTFGGVLYDAVTFRWAIFLIVIGELLSLISLVAYLVYEMCLSNKPEYTRYQ